MPESQCDPKDHAGNLTHTTPSETMDRRARGKSDAPILHRLWCVGLLVPLLHVKLLFRFLRNSIRRSTSQQGRCGSPRLYFRPARARVVKKRHCQFDENLVERPTRYCDVVRPRTRHNGRGLRVFTRNLTVPSSRCRIGSTTSGGRSTRMVMSSTSWCSRGAIGRRPPASSARC